MNKKYYLLQFFTVLVIFLPVLLFGGPGYYGDDLNFIDSIHQSGSLNGIVNWLSHYGAFYRPIGVSFLYLIYGLLGQSETLVYLTSYLIFIIFILVLFKYLNNISKNVFFSFFVTAFVAFFPLAPTAFFQISSTYQVFTASLVVFLIANFIIHNLNLTPKKLVLFCVAWFLLLLTYEQITGLVVIFFMISIMKNWPLNWENFRNKISKVIIGFSAATVIFTLIYVSAAGNPKLVTLKNLNNKEIHNVATSVETTRGSNIAKTQNRMDALILKIKKVLTFFSINIVYAINNLMTFGWKGLGILLPILILTIFILILPLAQPSTKFCYLCIIYGMSWFGSTIAPFLLYKAIHLPPYVMILPSIGLASITYGFFWLLSPKALFPYARKIFKFLFVVMIFIFLLQQYGYFFGLKEELAYWNTLETKLAGDKTKLIAGELIEIPITTQKQNKHIFWLEDAIGKRYFRVLMGEQFTNLVIEYADDQNLLKLYLKDPAL